MKNTLTARYVSRTFQLLLFFILSDIHKTRNDENEARDKDCINRASLKPILDDVKKSETFYGSVDEDWKRTLSQFKSLSNVYNNQQKNRLRPFVRSLKYTSEASDYFQSLKWNKALNWPLLCHYPQNSYHCAKMNMT